jgi:hypothetical protein
MYGYGYRYSVKPNEGSIERFTPLSLSPTFWFDYSLYSSGALAGTEKDVTD